MIDKPPAGYRLSASLNSLEDALLVLEFGSFRRAAEAIGVRPSVISRRIRALEDRMGVSLFQRQSQGAEPTLAGRRILSRGRLILDDVDSLIRTAALRGSGTEGQLCVGVVASIMGGVARELLATFLTDNPQVELHVVEGSSSDHLVRTRALQMDAIFLIGRAPIAGFDVHWLWSEPLHVVLPRNHPAASCDVVRWDQIVNERFLISKSAPGSSIQDFAIDQFSKFGQRPVVEPRSVSREGLFALVGLGLGVSLVGSAESEVIYRDIVFRQLTSEMLPFSVVWLASNDNPVLRRFLSLTRARLQPKAPVEIEVASSTRTPDL